MLRMADLHPFESRQTLQKWAISGNSGRSIDENSGAFRVPRQPGLATLDSFHKPQLPGRIFSVTSLRFFSTPD